MRNALRMGAVAVMTTAALTVPVVPASPTHGGSGPVTPTAPHYPSVVTPATTAVHCIMLRSAIRWSVSALDQSGDQRRATQYVTSALYLAAASLAPDRASHAYATRSAEVYDAMADRRLAAAGTASAARMAAVPATARDTSRRCAIDLHRPADVRLTVRTAA